MLKKLLMAASIIFIAIATKADDSPKIESKVQKVIVFLNGAQVTRTATVNISAGISTLVFSNISPDINVQSLQVHANGDFTILSVKSELNYFNEPLRQKDVEVLQAQEGIIRDKISYQNVLLNIDQQEEQTLMKNQIVTPQNAVLDITKLQQALDFQTARLINIRKRDIATNDQIKAYNVELQKINTQIADLTKDRSKVTNNVFVTVTSKIALQSAFTLSYVVNNARWYASYDIRAKNVNSPITIAYKANVSQQSGEDWKNVKLNLSTGNPSLSGIKPELDPYYLNFITYAPAAAMDKSSMSLSEVVVTGYGTRKKEYVTNPISMQQMENQTNMEFSINDTFSVPGDGKQYTVEINQVEIPAEYRYAVAPKISTNVFLTARLTDWNKYNFLPGEANIFFEGTYIGKSAINSNATADTLNLSLGADKSIVITRTLRNDFVEKRTLGANKKDTRDWFIAIKNRKNQPINLLVEDQVPVSQNSSIEVETQELSGGSFDKTIGKVSWNLTLNSQGEKKLDLKYQVRYPKNQSVIVQ
jgi:uncharacterized protein (TIGR02231 family)